MAQVEIVLPSIPYKFAKITRMGPLGLSLFDCEYMPLKIKRMVFDEKALKIKVENYLVEVTRTGTLPLIRTSTENSLYGPFSFPFFEGVVKSLGFVKDKATIDISSEVGGQSLFFMGRLYSIAQMGAMNVFTGFEPGYPGAEKTKPSKVTALGFAKIFAYGLQLPIEEAVWLR